jgi:pantoate--beta-alanine ligase
MWIARSKLALRQELKTTHSGIVLVPTMGALHDGHASLIKAAKQQAGQDGTVLVSIFVNPIQFDKPADLRNYPRTEEADLAICEQFGADGVFVPDEGEMYSPDRSITIIESKLSAHLCGATRPGHFDGVCTVVLKLFQLTRCDAAIFGKKDFQQLAIVRRMIRDLDLEVEIIAHPTIRESDGLAMSSRNRRLTREQRADAPRIHQALLAGAKETEAGKMVKTTRELIEQSTLARIDYLTLVDAQTMEPVENLNLPVVLACAVFYGEVRLIDHITLPL